jgi:APA family basic amino acid/polyamine antiporter
MSPLLLITALASIGAAMNATILIFSRFLFAMGRDGALPASLGRIHPRWGTPYVATTVVFVLGLLALLLPDDLIFLFLAANIPTMLKYFSNCWSALRLVDRHPALHAAAKFPMTRRSVRAWSLVGMACAAGIILAGLGADWRPYAILLAWGAVGSVYWFSYARQISRWMRDRTATAAPVISKR